METQLSYYVALQVINAANREVTAAKHVTADLAVSVDFPDFAVNGTYCCTICIKGVLVYVLEIELERIMYFIGRANTLSITLSA